MTKPLRALIIDDSVDDFDLLVRALKREYALSVERADSATGIRAALASGTWDVVLCDYNMPKLSGLEALEIVRAHDRDLPFIFVSGAMGEDVAVEAMRAGAHDYVMKGNLKRLPPAIDRELRDAGVRRDRMAAEARQHSTEARYRQILSIAPDAIVALDDHLQIAVFNQAAERLFGYRADDAIGKPADILLPQRLLGPVRDQVLAFAGAAETAMQIALSDRLFARRKDGSEFPAEIYVSKLVEDRRTMFTAIVRDLTDRETMQRQLLHAQRMEAVGQLTGGLAHDFNNLLAVVIGNLDLVQDYVEQVPGAKEPLDLALKASLGGANLIRQLLAFSRRQTLLPKPFELGTLVTSTRELLARTLGEHIEVEMRLAPDLWPVLADPSQLESALTNLAINARDAMPGGGRLTIEAANERLDEDYAALNPDAQPGDYVMLAVSDTGQGIPADVIGRVFEPFFTTKEHGKGSGLGLSMVYGFVRQSRGHVKIYSEVGSGTTVRLYLPRATQKSEPIPAAPSQAEPAKIDAVILVVEDNADVRKIVCKLLRDFGCTVLEASSGPAALTILKSDAKIDLLFSDVVMPGGMSGTELVQTARTLRPGIKTLLTTGFAEGSLRNSPQFANAGEILSKPYRRQDLARKLTALLGVKI